MLTKVEMEGIEECSEEFDRSAGSETDQWDLDSHWVTNTEWEEMPSVRTLGVGRC